MPERVHEMRVQNKVVRLSHAEYWCDQCGQRPMVHINPTNAKLSDPPRYEHQCPSCGAVANLLQRYPVIEYEWIEE